MAATSVTILKEYIEKETYTDHDYELFAHALDYAVGMSEICETLYCQLHDAAKEKQDWLFKERLQWALKIMTPMWVALGEPDRHEAWEVRIDDLVSEGYHWSDNRQCFYSNRTKREYRVKDQYKERQMLKLYPKLVSALNSLWLVLPDDIDDYPDASAFRQVKQNADIAHEVLIEARNI